MAAWCESNSFMRQIIYVLTTIFLKSRNRVIKCKYAFTLHSIHNFLRTTLVFATNYAFRWHSDLFFTDLRITNLLSFLHLNTCPTLREFSIISSRFQFIFVNLLFISMVQPRVQQDHKVERLMVNFFFIFWGSTPHCLP